VIASLQNRAPPYQGKIRTGAAGFHSLEAKGAGFLLQAGHAYRGWDKSSNRASDLFTRRARPPGIIAVIHTDGILEVSP